MDKLNKIGTSPNIVESIIVKLLTEGSEDLESHKRRWVRLKEETEKWLEQKAFEYFPSKVGITFWVKLPIKDTYRWMNEHAIVRYSLAAVPRTFFLFENGYKLTKSDMIRLSLGNINPEKPSLPEALRVLEEALNTY